jgi:hypothetical protein
MSLWTEAFPPVAIASLVEAELATGERVVWTGQPIPWRFARPSIPIVLLSASRRS